MSGDRVLAFESFRLDVATRCLTHGGELIALPPKAVDMLILLAENQGRTVLKQELMDRIWPQTFVEEGSVAQHISILRKALGDSSQDQEWIRTVPKRGYCFVPPVQLANERPAPVREASPPQVTQAMWWWWAVGAAAVLIIAGTLMLRPRPAPSIARLLVLPVENLSGDSAHDYVSDGLTEELIAQLSALDAGRLAVIARTSAMTYKGTKKPISQIGRELHVDYVIESSLRWSGNRLRITSQLVRAQDEAHIWGSSYERTASDMLSLEDEVARAISSQVDANLAGRQRTRAPLAQAYLPYLEGRYYWNKRTRESLERAIVLLRQAIALDPSYARAHAALADCYMSLGLQAGGKPNELFLRAKQEVLTAMSLDPNLAEAHTSLAYLKFWQEWDWPGAEAEFQKAIALNPDYATAHQWYAEYLRLMGRFDESVAESRKALDLDPLSLVINMEAGLPYYFRHQNREAAEHFQRAIDLDPNFALAYVELGWTYEELGQPGRAVETLEKAAQLDDTTPVLVALSRAYTGAGRSEDAKRVMAKLEQRARSTYVPPFMLSAAYLAMGDRQRALDMLEKAYREHDWGLVWLNVVPTFGSLRSEPRFVEVVRRMNFPKASS